MTDADPTRRFLSTTVDYAVVHSSLDGIITEWLGAAERVLGYSAAEAIGSSLSMFFTEDDRVRGLDAHEIAVALAQGRSEDDRWHLRKDGSRFWASGVLTRVSDENGTPTHLSKILRDRTDVRTQIEALENQQAAIQRQLEHERRTVRTLVHEIRNPLMPIASALALLQRPDAAQYAEKATRILMNQVDVLKRLLDDLGATGAAPTTALSLTLGRVSLNGVLSEMVDGLQDAARRCDQTLSLILPAIDIDVIADTSRLQQMLLNLTNNALKYTPAAGHIGISASIEADMAVVRIEDDGVGISADVLPTIFDLFTREGRHPEIEGQGVGLAMVKQLATAHGGFVEARSAGPGKGSIFTLRIPVARN